MGRNVKVILQPVTFRKRKQVAVLSPNNSEVDAVIREMEDVEWSTGYRFWHMPLKINTVKEITLALRGIASVDSSAFRNFPYDEIGDEKPKKKRQKLPKPSPEQTIRLQKFCNEYLSQGYSEGTMKVYFSLLSVFFGYFNKKMDTEITVYDIKAFMIDYIEKNHLTQNYKQLITNSLRRYFAYIGRNELTNI